MKMKKSLKRTAVLCAACIALLVLTACTQAGRRSFCQKIINRDVVEITALARQVLETETVPEDAFFDGVEEIRLRWGGAADGQDAWPVVIFQTGSRDDPEEQVSVGFYFSENDEPANYFGIGRPLTKDPLGEKYTWTAESGSVSYYTEHIQYGWYYYEYTVHPDMSPAY